MVRRTIAIGGGLLLLILLVFVFRGCLDARKERAMEDYVRGANELTKLSQAESRQLFDILSAPSSSDQSVNRANQANALRSDSATLSDRARDLDVPDELSNANDYLVEALDLRRDALAEVADQLPGALAQEERAQQHRSDRADDAGLPGERRAARKPLRADRHGGASEGGREREDRQGDHCPSSRRSNGSTPTSSPIRSPAFAAPTAAPPPAARTATVSAPSRWAVLRSRRVPRRPCRSPRTSPSTSRW